MSMAHFNDLPAELVLNILHRLTSKEADQTSLAAFARVAKKYRPIATEALYYAPIIPVASDHHGAVLEFLRALIKDATLSKFVHELVLPVTKRQGSRVAICRDPRCVHGPRELQDDVDRREDIHFRLCCESGGVEEILADEDWLPACWHEPELGSIILSMLSNLKALDIGTYQGPFDRRSKDGKIRPWMIATTTEDWFGSEESRVRENAMGGLAGLKHMACEGAVDFEFFQAPKLESLSLKSDLFIWARDVRPPLTTIISTSITSLNLQLNFWMLNDTIDEIEYLQHLLKGLPALRKLDVCFNYHSDPFCLEFDLRDKFGWDNIIKALRHTAPTLEELSIDVDIPFVDIPFVNIPFVNEVLSTQARSIGTSLRRLNFEKLKRLSILNEALCSGQMSHKVDSADMLPEGLESVEVVNPDHRTAAWVNGLTARKREGHHAALHTVSLRGGDCAEAVKVWPDAQKEGIEVSWS
jgi:hypothetical protein